MLTISGLDALPVATRNGGSSTGPTMAIMVPDTQPAPQPAIQVAQLQPACPSGFVSNQGVCVTPGCIDGQSECVVMDSTGTTCSYDQYLGYWHQSGTQACPPPAGPAQSTAQPVSVAPAPVAPAPPEPPPPPPPPPQAAPDAQQPAQQYVCADGSMVSDPSMCAAAAPADGSSSGMQVTPTAEPPTIAPPPIMPTVPTALPPLLTPGMMLGLGIVATAAAAFVAWRSEGGTRLVAGATALGVGAFTAYKASQSTGLSGPRRRRYGRAF